LARKISGIHCEKIFHIKIQLFLIVLPAVLLEIMTLIQLGIIVGFPLFFSMVKYTIYAFYEAITQ
jgi:hypothetical protein